MAVTFGKRAARKLQELVSENQPASQSTSQRGIGARKLNGGGMEMSSLSSSLNVFPAAVSLADAGVP